METKFSRELNEVVVSEDDCWVSGNNSTESHLLLAILEKLEEIRCGLIDIETSLPIKG